MPAQLALQLLDTVRLILVSVWKEAQTNVTEAKRGDLSNAA